MNVSGAGLLYSLERQVGFEFSDGLPMIPGIHLADVEELPLNGRKIRYAVDTQQLPVRFTFFDGE